MLSNAQSLTESEKRQRKPAFLSTYPPKRMPTFQKAKQNLNFAIMIVVNDYF